MTRGSSECKGLTREGNVARARELQKDYTTGGAWSKTRPGRQAGGRGPGHPVHAELCFWFVIKPKNNRKPLKGTDHWDDTVKQLPQTYCYSFMVK